MFHVEHNERAHSNLVRTINERAFYAAAKAAPKKSVVNASETSQVEDKK
jgi:hypothetical protein